MPFLLTLVIAVALVLWFGRGQTGTGAAGRLPRRSKAKPCVWAKVGDPPAGRVLQEYRCETCKVTAYSSTGKPPLQCKRNLDGTL